MICIRYFCADIKKLSQNYQMTTCEAFYSWIDFAPKSTAFFFNGMISKYLFYERFVGCIWQCCITIRIMGQDMQELRRGRKNTLFCPKYKSGGYIVRKLTKNWSFFIHFWLFHITIAVQLYMCILGDVDD